MSELSQEKKKQAFIKKAEENRARFIKHQQLREQIFGNISPKHLKTIYDNGAIEDMFLLNLIDYAEAYHQWKLEQLNLPVVVVPKDTLCDVCGSENTITVSHEGANCDWCNPL